MIKTNLKSAVMAFAVILGLSACDKSSKEPEVPQEDPEFALSVSELKPESVKISCTPKDDVMPYVCMVLEKSIFDRFANGEALQNDNLSYFNYLAEQNETTLYAVLSSFIITGKLVEDPVDDLTPGTEYCLYAYGIDYRGEATTEITSITFTAPNYPDVQMKDVTFDITVSEITYNSATATVKTQEGITYVLDLLSEDEYAQYGNSDSAFQAYVEEEFSYYRANGYTDEEIISNLTLSYPSVQAPCSSLTPSTKYYIFALSLDEYLRVDSKPSYVTFTTEDVEPSDNTFTISVSQLYHDGVAAWIYPSNSDPYFWDVIPASDVTGKSDEQVMKDICNKYVSLGVSLEDFCESEKCFISNAHDLNADSDYYICVFGWDCAPTTGLTKKKVHTALPPDYSTLTLSFETYDITSSSTKVLVTPNDNNMTYVYSIVKASDFNERLKTEGSADALITKLVQEEIDYYVNYYNNTYSATNVAGKIAKTGPDNATFGNLESSTDYVIWGAAINTATAAPGCDKGFYVEVKTK